MLNSRHLSNNKYLYANKLTKKESSQSQYIEFPLSKQVSEVQGNF